VGGAIAILILEEKFDEIRPNGDKDGEGILNRVPKRIVIARIISGIAQHLGE
jgi:hypothetical protein